MGLNGHGAERLGALKGRGAERPRGQEDGSLSGPCGLSSQDADKLRVPFAFRAWWPGDKNIRKAKHIPGRTVSPLQDGIRPQDGNRARDGARAPDGGVRC